MIHPEDHHLRAELLHPYLLVRLLAIVLLLGANVLDLSVLFRAQMGQPEEAVRHLDALLADHPEMSAAIEVRGALMNDGTSSPRETDPDKWFA